jgi:Glucanosyltransferase
LESQLIPLQAKPSLNLSRITFYNYYRTSPESPIFTTFSMLSKLALAFCLVALASNVLAIPTISAVGSKFFTSDGKQFYIKGSEALLLCGLSAWPLSDLLAIGVAYQLIDQDPLVDTNQCKLDANLMKQLGANVIRVYHVDASADHSGCMNAFAEAGIYLFVDMDSFKTYIGLVSSQEQSSNKRYNNTSNLNAEWATFMDAGQV